LATACPDGWFEEVVEDHANVCTSCDTSCATCNDDTSCESCASGYYWKEEAEPPKTGLCTNTCATARTGSLFQDDDTCKACDETCTECYGKAVQCTKCADGGWYNFPHKAEDLCTETCDEGYTFQDQVFKTCLANCQDTGAKTWLVRSDDLYNIRREIGSEEEME